MGETHAARADVPAWVAWLARPEVWLVGVALAAFLALAWAIRGAPIGQAAREEPGPGSPSPGRRDRLAALAALGVVLVACGAYLAPAVGIPWSFPAFGLGFASLIAAGRGARPYRHVSPVLRRVVRFSETALTASLLAGILLVANVAAFRYGDRPLDLTRERAFTLEPETAEQLRTLRRPVRLTAFYYGRIPQALKQIERVQQLLALFRSANPERVTIDFVNFHGDPARADELARRVPDATLTTGGVVVELGEGETAERLVVRNSEMFPEPAGAAGFDGGATAREFRGEYALTTALIRLREGRKVKVAVTTGHGESPISELDVSRRGAGLLRSRLADVGFEVVEVELGRGEVPEDAAVVLVLGPRSPFHPDEAGRLKGYLDRGGRGLFLVGGRAGVGLDELLKGYDVGLGSALVVEPAGPLGAPTATVPVRIPETARHPIVATLSGQTVAVPNASPLIIPIASNRTNPGVAPVPILQTSPRAWGESDPEAARVALDPEEDVPGPITVGVAVAEAKSPGGPADDERPRLVVLSSPDLADNRFARYVGYETNLDLVVNSVNWLRGRLDLPAIAPRTRTLARLDADPAAQVRLVLLPTLLSVSVLLGLGTAVYLARRS